MEPFIRRRMEPPPNYTGEYKRIEKGGSDECRCCLCVPDPNSFYEGALAGGSLASALKGPRENFSPEMRQYLSIVDDKPVIEISVIRKPVSEYISTIMRIMWKVKNIASLGRKFPHDKLFHLLMSLKLSDGSEHILEKNEILTFKPFPDKLREMPYEEWKVPLQKPGTMTVNSMLRNTIARYGIPRVFHYNAFNDNYESGNCQRYVLDTFDANDIPMTIGLRNWILQDVASLAPAWGKKITNLAANLKSRLGLITKGDGFSEGQVMMTRNKGYSADINSLSQFRLW